jgi:hypothetical protein
MANCDDPFDERWIPVVPWVGFCAITRSVLSGYETYMVIRSCMPNCRNIYDDGTNVECCFGNLCNGAKSGAETLWRSERNLVIAIVILNIVNTIIMLK